MTTPPNQKTAGKFAQAYDKRLIEQHTKPLLQLINKLVQHLDYIGWGDNYEREGVCAKGGLADQVKAVLKEAGLRS